jgi:hypothetical protein
MRNTTPFLPSFGSLLFGRRSKSEQAKALEKLKSANTLGKWGSVCIFFQKNDNMLVIK